MTTRALVLAYLLFFFTYFFGFQLLAHLNTGVPFSWSRFFDPLDLSFYTYTIITVCLSHFVVFRRFYPARPRWKLFAAILGLLAFFILFRYSLEELIFPAVIGYGNYYPATSFRFYVLDNIYFGSFPVFIGFVFYLFDEMFRNRKRQAALQQRNREAELRFLEAQMNPHFLFNSLNNIYSLALEQNPQTPAAILKLSDMMRYVTYRKEKTVLLADELNYVNDLLAIEQLRCEYPLQSRLELEPAALQSRIPPLLLVPLVENALKHGDLSDPAQPLTLQAGIRDEKLYLSLINKTAGHRKTETGGVGMENLRRRLELLYQPQQYAFSQEKTDQQFFIQMQIPVQ